eukprot:gene12279-12365_t
MNSHRLYSPGIVGTQPSASEVAATRSITGLRIFLAEDEPMILMLLEDVIETLGCVVAGTAKSVVAALAFASHEQFDLAILDGKLEDGTIDTVARTLVARQIPFILASGLAANQFSDSLGAAVLLQKPYLMQDLSRAIEQVARQLPYALNP